MTVQEQPPHLTLGTARPARFAWLDWGLFGYLALVVGLYANGARLAGWLGSVLGPMPVRGGLWSWAWSVNRVEPRQAAGLLGLVLAGGVLGAAWPRLKRQVRAIFPHPPAPWPVALAAGLAAVPVMWYARVGSSLGDFFNYAFMLRYGNWFIMSQPLSTALLAAGHALLAGLGWPTVARAALVICLAGGVWVALVVKLAGELPGWQPRLLILCALLTGGVGLFFGYLESTPLALAAALGYFYLGRAVLVRQAPLWPAALALGVAVAMHGQMLYLGPSFLVLVVETARRGAGRAIGWSSLLAILPAVLVVALALANPELIEGPVYGDALGGGDNRMFVPLEQPATYAEYYRLFSFNYFTELLNLVIRTAPLLGLLLVPAGWNAWHNRRAPLVWWLAAIAAGALLFVLVWNPDLGMAHDWDLFAPAVMLAAVAGVGLWPPEWRPRLANVWWGLAAGFGVATLAVTVTTFQPILAWGVWDTGSQALGQRLEARFGESIDLLGYSGLQPAYRPGDPLPVELYWRARDVLPVDYTAGVYLIDLASGSPRVIAQDDHRPEAPVPADGPRYSSLWILGEVVRDQHTLAIPADTPSGEYEVWVVLYDLATGARLPVAVPGTAREENFLRLSALTLN